jgi:hypothetical protein
MLRGAKTNRRGIILTFICGYVICLIGFYVPSFNAVQQQIAVRYAFLLRSDPRRVFVVLTLNRCVVVRSCGCFCYLADFAAYYKIKTTFGNLPRDYVSPFGLYGAYLGALITALVFISAMFFQVDGTPLVGGTGQYVTLIALSIISGVLSFYYEFFARKYQTFSKEEERTVFRLHVIIFNARKVGISTVPQNTRRQT